MKRSPHRSSPAVQATSRCRSTAPSRCNDRQYDRGATMSILIFFGITAVLMIYVISLYNHLVSVKHAVSKAWANIDVLLKQRHDELPKLVEVCKQYKQFEQATLQKVIEARSRVQTARERQDIGALGLPRDGRLF